MTLSKNDWYEQCERQELWLPAGVATHSQRAIGKLIEPLNERIGAESPALIIPVELARGGAREAEEEDATVTFGAPPSTGLAVVLESSLVFAWWVGNWNAARHSVEITYPSIKTVTRCYAETRLGRYGAVEILEEDRWVAGISGLRPSKSPALWHTFAQVLQNERALAGPELGAD